MSDAPVVCRFDRLGTMEAVPYGLSRDLSTSMSRERGDDKVQSIELPVSQLGLFLFLHLHPDSTTHRRDVLVHPRFLT